MILACDQTLTDSQFSLTYPTKKISETTKTNPFSSPDFMKAVQCVRRAPQKVHKFSELYYIITY